MPRHRLWQRARSRLAWRALRVPLAVIVAASLAAGTVAAITKQDPGKAYQHSLAAQSKPLFGFGHPLQAGATGSTDAPGAAAVEAAGGLTVSVVSDKVGEDADMIALWPNHSSPSVAFICNEIDSTAAGNVGKPTVQRVDLATGDVTDLITGTTSCR